MKNIHHEQIFSQLHIGFKVFGKPFSFAPLDANTSVRLFLDLRKMDLDRSRRIWRMPFDRVEIATNRPAWVFLSASGTELTWSHGKEISTSHLYRFVGGSRAAASPQHRSTWHKAVRPHRPRRSPTFLLVAQYLVPGWNTCLSAHRAWSLHSRVRGILYFVITGLFHAIPHHPGIPLPDYSLPSLAATGVACGQRKSR